MATLTLPLQSTGDQALHRTSAVAEYPPAGAYTNDLANTQPGSCMRRWNGSVYSVGHYNMAWNTGSVIPDNATVLSAYITLYCTTVNNADSLSFVMEYYAWTGVQADWTNTPSATAHTGTALASITASAGGTANNFTLTNLSNISLTGNTSVRSHITQRAADAAPIGSNQILHGGVGHATILPPELTVEYCIPHKLVTAPFSGVFSGLRSN